MIEKLSTVEGCQIKFRVLKFDRSNYSDSLAKLCWNGCSRCMADWD